MPLPVLGNLSIQDEDGKPQKENEWFKSERKLVVQKRGGRHAVYHSHNFFPLMHQSYQLVEDLGRAFLDRAILQTFLDAEATVSSGPLKVNIGTFLS